MLLNYNVPLKHMQMKYLDDETFNFLIELRVVSLGSYHTVIRMFKTDTKSGKQFMEQCIRFWNINLGRFNPNVFQIAYCARKGFLTAD